MDEPIGFDAADSEAQRTAWTPFVNASSRRGRNRDWVLIGSFLTVVAAASVYRATTQGIVHDEAVTYLMFVAGPLEHVFTRYTANNHVLFTLAANATTHLL